MKKLAVNKRGDRRGMNNRCLCSCPRYGQFKQVRHKLGCAYFKPSECHPTKAHFAKGLCRWCYYTSTPEKRVAIRKKKRESRWQINDRLVRRHGITLAEYEALLVKQNGACAVCRDACDSGMRLAVDHDHSTGRIRGLLCRRCNQGIGVMRDDPARLRRAADYLEAKR